MWILLMTAVLLAGSVMGGDMPELGDSHESPLPVGVDWLVNYYGNGPRQEDKYADKILRVEGWVSDRGTDEDDRDYLMLQMYSARASHTRCIFPAGTGIPPDGEGREDIVAVSGTCRGYDPAIDAVVLVNCQYLGIASQLDKPAIFE